MSTQLENNILYGIMIISIITIIYIVIDYIRNSKSEVQGFKCFITKSEYYILMSRVLDLKIKCNTKPSLGEYYVALTFYGDVYVDDDGEMWTQEEPFLVFSKSKTTFNRWKYRETSFETIMDYIIELEENNNSKIDAKEI